MSIPIQGALKMMKTSVIFREKTKSAQLWHSFEGRDGQGKGFYLPEGLAHRSRFAEKMEVTPSSHAFPVVWLGPFVPAGL